MGRENHENFNNKTLRSKIPKHQKLLGKPKM